MSSKQSRKKRELTSRFKDAERNHAAEVEGPAVKKKWSTRDMQHLVAKTDRQEQAIRAWEKGVTGLALIGSAGTGKTYLAVQLALREALGRKLSVVCVRSTVQSREQGFLKGTIEEKEAPFREVYSSEMANIFGRDNTFNDMVAAKLLSFHSTSFLRGKTFNDSVILVDECQNMSFEELSTVITRVGENSRIILMGDTRQADIGKQSGLKKVLGLFDHMPDGSLDQIVFMPQDVVRSGFVRDWLQVLDQNVPS